MRTDINDRIKLIRNKLGYTQQQLADIVCLTPGMISSYELKKTQPPKAIISLLCSKLNINEEWINYGIGNMYSPPKENSFSLDDYANKHNLSIVEKKIIIAYMLLPEKDRKNLVDYIESIIKKEK